MLNIQEKITNLFSDDIIENKRLVYSPNKQIPSKYNKNLPDNQINIFNKNDNSLEISNYNKNSNSKKKKKHLKKIKDNLKNEDNPSLSKILTIISNIYDNNIKNDEKDLKEEINLKSANKKNKEKKEESREIKESKEIKDNKENKENKEIKMSIDIDDDDYLNKYELKRSRGRSHHIKNKVESLACFKGILRRDSKKNNKKQKFELDKEDEIKIEEKDKNIISDDEKNKNKEKKKNKSRNKIDNKSLIVHKMKNKINNTIGKIRGNIIDSNNEIKNDNHKLKVNNSLFMKSAKVKSKRKKKINLSKYKPNTKEKEFIQNLRHNSQKKIGMHKKVSKIIKKESFESSSQISSFSDNNKDNSLNKNYNEKKSEYKKKEKKSSLKNINNDNKSSDNESNFQSSKFSKESKDDIFLSNSLIKHNYKSSKNVLFSKNIKTNNKTNNTKFKGKNKKSSVRKANINSLNKLYNNKNQLTTKNDDDSYLKIEECKDSSNYIKTSLNPKESENIIINSFNSNDIQSSEIKVKKLSNKKKERVHSQFQISKNVNNVFIFPNKENKNNIYQNNNQNLNIINPSNISNIISIEYNNNLGKKSDKNLESNNNNITIKNNQSNNITSLKKETLIKIDEVETQNQFHNKLNEKKEINSNKDNNNELINSKEEIINNKKKSKKKSKIKLCFGCL